MIAIDKLIKRFCIDESGSTAIEYSLIASTMGLMLIPFFQYFSSAFGTWGQTLSAAFDTVMGV